MDWKGKKNKIEILSSNLVFSQVYMVRLNGIECCPCGWIQFHGCAETCLNYAEEEEEEDD